MTLGATLFGYIGRQFLAWFAAAFAVILALMFLGDVADLIRRAAGRPDVSIMIILKLAGLKVPSSGLEVLPFAVLLGSILALWRLTRSQELVVARAAGVSVWQFLMPAILLAFLIGTVGITCFNPLASAMTASYTQLDNRLLRNQPDSLLLSHSGLWLRQSDGAGNQAVIHSMSLHQPEMRLTNVTILFFDGNDVLSRRIDAAQAVLEPGNWHVTDAYQWLPTSNESTRIAQLDVPTNLTSAKIKDSFASPETLSFWALPGFIELLERSGFSAERHRLYFDSLLARPFLLCALVLIAAIFSLRMQRRGGTTALLVGGVAVGFLLYFLQDVVYALGNSQTIPVALAAWTPAGVSALLGATFLLHLEDG